MNILMILPDLCGGGAERVALSLARGLIDRGDNVTLFLMKKMGVYWNEIPAEARVVFGLEGGRLRYRFPRLIWSACAQGKQHDIIIGTQEMNATYLALIVGKTVRKPVVGWVHTVLDQYLVTASRPHQLLCKFVYGNLDRVICVSNGVRESLARFVGKSIGPHWEVIYNSFDPHVYDLTACVNADTSSLPIVIAIGRLNRQKGFDVLIRAHAKIRERNINHRLLILGEGPERDNLETLAVSLGVRGSIEMPGFVSNPMDYIKKASVFALSSLFEGLPTVILEALAAGIPVVSTDSAGPSEILSGGKFGMLVPCENVDALADGIETLLTNPERRAHYREVGTTRWKDFLPDAVIPRWTEYLDASLV